MDDGTHPLQDIVGSATRPFQSLLRRLRHNYVTVWLLYRGQRWAVSVALLGGVFLTFVGLAFLRPVDMTQLLSDTTTLQTLFSQLLSGAILLVSVVSSISSIVLTKEISDIDTEQRRIEASVEFRERTEDLIDADVTPGRPADFLAVILATIYDETQTLRTVAARSGDRAFDEEIHSFTDEVLEETKTAAETLDGARFGTFDVLSAGLNYDYSWQLNAVRQIRNRYEDSLTEEETDALSDMVDTLEFFATGREHFQSMYYKREVAQLSSMLLYVSLPVIIYISYLLLALDSSLVPVFDVWRISSLSLFVIASYTLSLAPYVVLTAHVIRVAALTLKNLDAGPFMVRQRENRDIVELNVSLDPDEWESPDVDKWESRSAEDGASDDTPNEATDDAANVAADDPGEGAPDDRGEGALDDSAQHPSREAYERADHGSGAWESADADDGTAGAPDKWTSSDSTRDDSRDADDRTARD